MPSNKPKARHRARSLKTRPDPRSRDEHVAAMVSLDAPPKFYRLLESLTSEQRKTYPMTAGLGDYFPDALADVAHISWQGNEKHNPGEPLHWARGKSMDHADCIARHLQQRGTVEELVLNGMPMKVRHSAQLAWRALALLQEELENEFGYALPRSATREPT